MKPDFYTLYRAISEATEAKHVEVMQAIENRQDYKELKADWKALSTLRFALLDFSCMSVSYYRQFPELPQRAASRQQEFGYISEDDGQYHTTRRIDWDYLLG